MELKRYSVTWAETFALFFLIYFLLELFILNLINMLIDISDFYFYSFPALIISLLIITKREKIIYKESDEKLEMNTSTVNLLYFLSIIVPFAGLFIFLILASKNEENYRLVGRNCLIITVFSIIFLAMILTAIMYSLWMN